MTVLHYKSNFLNKSETFIHRTISNHSDFEPAAMCINSRSFTDNLKVYQKPQTGWKYIINTIYFHLNWCLPFYKETIKRVQPSIIHAHFGFDGYRMMKPAKSLNVPLIVSFYGSDVTRLPDEFYWERRYNKLAKFANAFIAASKHMKQQLINLGFPQSKIHVIPFGLDLTNFNFNSDRPHSKKIMMVGRMVEKKGFQYAIEAINFLNQDGFNYTLNLFGDGALREELETTVNTLGIKDQVNFHGYVTIERVLKEHALHDILLAPSITAKDGDEEGLPNTILEAMASGIPVIATDHAAIDEAITHKKSGLIIEQGNPKALAEAIKYAKSTECNLNKLGANARKTIESQFEIHSVVDQIESLYQEIITDHD